MRSKRFRLDRVARSRWRRVRGCTHGPSPDVALGYEGVASEVRAVGRPGIPVVTPNTSAIAGFAHLGIRRISLLTPYLDSVNQAMRAFLEAHGIEVVNVGGFCMEDDGVARAVLAAFDAHHDAPCRQGA